MIDARARATLRAWVLAELRFYFLTLAPAIGIALVASLVANGLLAAARLTSPAGAVPPPRESAQPHQLDPLIQQAAARHLPPELDWRLLKALVWKESNFDARARSPAGAMGLTQLMPGTARELGLHSPAEIFDPRLNLDAGARYLAQMLHAWRDQPQPERLRLALASYNWGIGNVRRAARAAGQPRWSAIAPRAPLETRDYVHRILEVRLPAELARDGLPGAGPGRPAWTLPGMLQRR